MNLINTYKNGPVEVSIYDDGTKTRTWDDEVYGVEPKLEFPESCDVKITNQCDMGCPFCHEQSTASGLHGDLYNFMRILKNSNLPKGVEFAIGGGNPMSHPEIWQFLRYCYNQGYIINMTMNLAHLMRPDYFGMTMRCLDQGLIKGLGISVSAGTFMNQDSIDTLLKFYKKTPNVVLHLIEGINSYEITKKYLLEFANKNQLKIKVLILGKKDFGRYSDLNIERQRLDDERTKEWSNNIMDFIKCVSELGGVIAFDNLAIDRLNILNKLPSDVIDSQYMGQDGTHTMYIDLVEQQFSKQSTSPKNKRFPLKDNLREMYQQVFETRKEN